MSQSRIAQFEAFLSRTGKRLTPERKRVAEFLFSFSGPFDDERIIKVLAEEFPGNQVARSTVYRTLKQLQDAGLIVRE